MFSGKHSQARNPHLRPPTRWNHQRPPLRPPEHRPQGAHRPPPPRLPHPPRSPAGRAPDSQTLPRTIGTGERVLNPGLHYPRFLRNSDRLRRVHDETIRHRSTIRDAPHIRPTSDRSRSATLLQHQDKGMGSLQSTNRRLHVHEALDQRPSPRRCREVDFHKAEIEHGQQQVGRHQNQREDGKGQRTLQVKTHHIFPIPAADGSTDNLKYTIDTLNRLFEPKPQPPVTPNTTQNRAATQLIQQIDLANLDEIIILKGTQLINLLAETGNIIGNDISTNPKQGYVRGIFIEEFDPQRLALPPENKRGETKHGDWNNYLDTEQRNEITTHFEKNLANLIITAIETKTNLPKPRCYCKNGSYPTMLQRMNKSGLIAWRLDETRATKLSNYADILELTNFAITKDADNDRLISWPRITNTFAKPPPPPDLPDPSLFQFLVCDQEKQKWTYLDVSNMFHNMGIPFLMTELFPLPLIKYGDLYSETKRDIQIAIGTPHLHDSALIRPAQETMQMGFTWAVSLAHNDNEHNQNRLPNCETNAYHLRKRNNTCLI